MKRKPFTRPLWAVFTEEGKVLKDTVQHIILSGNYHNKITLHDDDNYDNNNKKY